MTTHSASDVLEIPKDVIDQVMDAIETVLMSSPSDYVSNKLGPAHLRLQEAIEDAEAIEP